MWSIKRAASSMMPFSIYGNSVSKIELQTQLIGVILFIHRHDFLVVFYDINYDIGKRVAPTAEILAFLYAEASFCPASRA